MCAGRWRQTASPGAPGSAYSSTQLSCVILGPFMKPARLLEDRTASLASGLCVTFLLAFVAIQPLYVAVVRMSYRHQIGFSYNEGWNVINTARLLQGQNLYVSPDRFPLTPVGYPPLSFVIVGALSHFTP